MLAVVVAVRVSRVLVEQVVLVVEPMVAMLMVMGIMAL
jgi:hypothetical protein